MGMNMNHMVTQSLQKQLNQVWFWQNEKENVIKMESSLLEEAMKFHTLEKVHYIMSKISKKNEWPIG
jgi:hypothetical protein